MITQLNYYYDQADRRKQLYATKTKPPTVEPSITKGSEFYKNKQKMVYSANERKVVCFKSGTVYASIEEACEQTGISNNRMQGLLKAKKEWEYIEELKPVVTKKTMDDRNLRGEQSKCKPVRHIPTGTIYESIRQAGEQGISPFTTVKNHCHGHCKRPVWEFV